MRYRWVVACTGVLSLALWAYAAATIGDLSQSIPRFLAIQGVLFVLYGVSVFAFSRLHGPGRGLIAWIFVVAVGARAIGVPASPTLSTDIYRYLWEGRVVTHGGNPFAEPPVSGALMPLRDDNFEAINHPQLETIYPPFAQFVFASGAWIRADLVTQKVLFTLFDLGTLVVILLWLRARRRNPNLCAVYGWSPLVITEFSRAGHVDAVGIFWFVFALYLIERRRNVAGYAALAVSFLSKYLTAILLPYLVRRCRHRWGLALFGAIIVAGYVPFADAGLRLFASLGQYGRHWEFNSIVFRLANTIMPNGDVIRIVLALGLVVFVWLRAKHEPDLARYAFQVIGCALLLAPTVYPWYVCWIVPLLCLFTSRAWLAYSGLVMTSYWVWTRFAENGAWTVGWPEMLIEYLPFYALLFWEWRRGWHARPIATGEQS